MIAYTVKMGYEIYEKYEGRRKTKKDKKMKRKYRVFKAGGKERIKEVKD